MKKLYQIMHILSGRDPPCQCKEHKEDALRYRRLLENSIKAFAHTIEKRDPYTAGHQRNVSKLAVSIAKKVDLPYHDITGIRLASSVHDIGKIRIPAEILSNTGKLTTAERMMVETHSLVGYEILNGIDYPWPLAEMVLQHHERMDGSGYPNRLHCEDIIMGSRIIAVADVVDAMSSHRPYRAALGKGLIVEELEANKNSLYDPDVVDACLSVFDKGPMIDLTHLK